ncbi:MAG: restriction endonuclease [Actinomycetota bacterium]|nr:restriction endonuclease [Actinomycetota bacterium]MDQ3638509.1 restriction endonuclease [Actinomycetota bacterium]
MKGPRFVRYFGPVLTALRGLGNSGTPTEVREAVAQNLELSDGELNAQLSSGTSRFDNQVAWARFYLAKADYIDASERGVWRLTEIGKQAELDHDAALAVFREVQQRFQVNRTVGEETPEIEEADAPYEEDSSGPDDHRQVLLKRIKSLSPPGFERLCQRLLRESGFQHVEVTGRSSDGGIDGVGILRVNPLMSFRVLFQCKRYSNAIVPSQMRDFRGAITGRVDKGIFITTSTFTVEARREANRDGVPPIELVDAEKLASMFEELRLGLVPRIVYELDKEFFDEFE